ncbi:hypothetical protein GCM10010922_26510 [Microbacterium sorbitolivorans]|uniref:Uncharacterized protein n=1 Tax=Microbacterium sorbitolivorans TaxID=1867410 RepID=A0A367XVM9_9MICO|nr:hypothetical protein [Microbacterium sorbitolivorans]RCK56852.1 hypothetical protein DTO57_13285 [Microbacterium sorbitolivorans]GGF49292.1 hypothetical protein GCM10010922_26510 [Microbacterium sorbitolivorans]
MQEDIVRKETEARPARPTLRVLAATLLVCVGIILPSAATSSDATWNDSESASGSLSAATIPPPTRAASCTYSPGLLGLGARVQIYWYLPAGYSLGSIVTEASTSGLGSALAPLTGFSLSANTTLQSNGSYRTEVPTNLLGGLLGLGSELEISLSVADPSGWRSQPLRVATNAGLIAGLGGNCRNLN